MRLPWIASSRTDKQVAGDFLVPSFTKKWSSLESTVREQPSTDRFLIKCDDARFEESKETSIEGWYFALRERRGKFIETRDLYTIFHGSIRVELRLHFAREVSNRWMDRDASCHGWAGKRVWKRELKRSPLQAGFFQMTTRDIRERGKFWPGFRGHLDAYTRHRRSRKSSFRCRATCPLRASVSTRRASSFVLQNQST